MAKKKSAVKKTASGETLSTLAALVALDRAYMVVKEKLPKGAPKLDPGSYAIAASVEIAGDIVIAEPVETKGSEGPDVKIDDLLTGLCVGKTQEEIEALLNEGMGQIREAMNTKTAQAEFAATAERVQQAIESVAKRRKFWRVTPAGTRAGATTGKPFVSIDGTVSVNGSEVQLDMVVGEKGVKQAA